MPDVPTGHAERIVRSATTHFGYWLALADSGVFSFGNTHPWDATLNIR
jgi:alpha-D-ribose 1-methylphosphonate 5-triphosphate synthase subunit PhnI